MGDKVKYNFFIKKIYFKILREKKYKIQQPYFFFALYPNFFFRNKLTLSKYKYLLLGVIKSK